MKAKVRSSLSSRIIARNNRSLRKEGFTAIVLDAVCEVGVCTQGTREGEGKGGSDAITGECGDNCLISGSEVGAGEPFRCDTIITFRRVH